MHLLQLKVLNQLGEVVELDPTEVFKGPGTGIDLSWADADITKFPR